MKAKAKKYSKKLRNHNMLSCRGQIREGAMFTNCKTGEVAVIICIARHTLSGRELVIVFESGKSKAIPVSVFEMMYQKILEEGEVPF